MHVSSHNAATGFVRVTPRTLLCSGRWCPSRQLKRVIDTPPHMRTRRRVARRPARFGSERGFSATANSGTSLPDDGRLSPVPPAVTPPRPDVSESPSVVSPQLSESDGPTNASFKKRVEAAAMALRSGRASQTRRKPPQFTNPASAEASNGVPARAFAPPTRSTKSNTPTSRSSRTNDTTSTPASLIEQTDNSEQMAASQRRLFEQMVTLRTRLNERLAASNKFAKYLESTLHARDKDIKHANERLVAAMLEVESLQQIARDAVEAAESEAQPSELVSARLATLTKRLELMHAALRRDVKDIDAACIKCVPIRWVGMASDIRIMGSFDHWTKGVAMSPEFIEGGNNVFVADMMLVSGTYEIKFVVDGVWQTAPEWATTGDGLDANNLLVVE